MAGGYRNREPFGMIFAGSSRVTGRAAVADRNLAAEIIRIRPRRVISFNVDPERPGFAARDVKLTSSSEAA